MKRVVGVVGIALSLITIGLPAQALTWVELQQKAIEANPDLRSLKSETESKEFLRKANYGSYWPQLFLFAQQDRQNGKNPTISFDSLTTTYSLVNNRYYSTVNSYGAKATLEIFSGFSTAANLEHGAADYDIANSRFELKSVELRYVLATNYIQWLMAQKSSETSEKILLRLRQNQGLIKIKYDNGLEAKWALDQANIEVQLAEVRLRQDRQRIDEASANIAQLLQEPVKLEADPVIFQLGPLSEPTDSKLSSHPQVKYYQSLEAGYQADRKLSRSSYYPRLDASYTWVNNWEREQGTVHDNLVSVSLTWNIFDGLTTTYRTRSASAAMLSASLGQQAFMNQLRTDLTQQKRDYDLTITALELKKAQLKNAESRANTVSSQYRNGLRRYADWEAAQSRLIDLERERLEYEQQAMNLKISWEKNIGLKLGDL